MRSTSKRLLPIERQLEAYIEAWKLNHDDAMACRDWEDAIAVGTSVFRMLVDREQSWRDQVFRGVIPSREEDNKKHQGRFTLWLQTTKKVLQDTLPALEKEFGAVEGAELLRQCAAHVEEILRKWEPPRLSMAVGLRDMTLSGEAATALDRIIEDAQSNPPLKQSGSVPQQTSAEDFAARLGTRRP
jgi:hypothetical protein